MKPKKTQQCSLSPFLDGWMDRQIEREKMVIVQSSSLIWLFVPAKPLCPRQEYGSEQPFPCPGDLPDPWIDPGSCLLQLNSVLTGPPGKPREKMERGKEGRQMERKKERRQKDIWVIYNWLILYFRIDVLEGIINYKT